MKYEYYVDNKKHETYKFLSIPFSTLHRDNGPALVQYDNNNILMTERYYKNGKWHRDNGPAIIDYNRDGKICSEEYYLHNREYYEDEYLFLYLNNKLMSPDLWPLDFKAVYRFKYD